MLEPEHEWDTDRIKKGECECEVERGEKYDQIHAHVFIGISHYSKLQLNRKEIYDKICEYMELPSIYISRIQILRHSAETDRERWLAYAHKNISDNNNDK
jgi:hypothetical protein